MIGRGPIDPPRALVEMGQESGCVGVSAPSLSSSASERRGRAALAAEDPAAVETWLTTVDPEAQSRLTRVRDTHVAAAAHGPPENRAAECRLR